MQDKSVVRASDLITEGRGFESHLGIGFFRVPVGSMVKLFI